MKKTIFLHIGFHKTATTFLQRSIYPNLMNVKRIRKKRINQELYDLRVRKLNEGDILRIRTKIDSLGKEGVPTLISYEGLSGSPFKRKRPKNNIKILEDLRRVFPEELYDVHIIIGLREQVRLITSLYIQYLHMGGYKKADNYLNDLDRMGVLDNYKYDTYLENVERLFGSNYYVFVYEKFQKEPNDYLLKLLNYMGEEQIPEYKEEPLNRSYGVMQAKIARRLNYFFKTKMNPDGMFPVYKIKGKKMFPRTFLQNKISYKIHYKRFELSDDLQNNLKNRYNEENRKLNKRRNLELTKNYLD
ncbi:hypothetical protein GWK91_11360 [Virgibacillus sp. MSP4-1]|uniref:hypothetical protein n=1 Tax=Virgibacillus sp. MSP4-1 TaxID=2700081 RepID=UPI0003A9E499|nr:hypothetical protein [Virgibacillus sp. MSP4-1]QHS23520.1 hypothetical protein GWK91_11360 [Virgibacillus sp. MSP4-1]